MGIRFERSAECPEDGSGGDPAAVGISAGLYGRLLLLYPRTFRDEYAEEMGTVFADLCREEYGSEGKAGLAAVWRRALPDLLAGVAAERSKAMASALRKDGGFGGLRALLLANGLLFCFAGAALFVNALWVLEGLGLLRGEVPPSGPHPGWEMILPEKLVAQTLGVVLVFFGMVLIVARGLGRHLAGAVTGLSVIGNALIASAVAANNVQYPTAPGWAVFWFFVALAAAYAALGVLAAMQAGQRGDTPSGVR